uniref:Siderophore iron transporter mirB n=1 Tax=Talaromyces marneffei PM1 TaxID=1077442 RepID=A0A093X970_TALMA
MGVLDNIRGRDTSQLNAAVYRSEPADVPVEQKSPGHTQDMIASDSDTLSLEARNEKEVQLNPDQITANAELGVQKAEAVTLVWSKRTVYAVYAWIWICFFMLAFQSAVGNNLFYTAYSEFALAPAVSTASILASVIGGVLKLAIGKTLNLVGRAEGLLFFVAVYILGIILLASCNGPDAYAAGYVLYWIGYNAIYLILDVFMADTSGLRNRAFAFGFVTTPFICTAFTGSLAAQSFVRTSGWRWGYGAFTIIMPFVFIPLAVVFKFYERKAIKLGLFKRESSGRTTMQSIIHYFHEFDIIGAFLLMAAFVLFLLPFSLQTSNRITYDSAAFIAMVVIGILLFPAFAIWEAYFARTQFIQWELFKNRTVLGACICAATVNFAFYCWDLYYYYFIMVVYNLDISLTGYMSQIYNVGSCFFGRFSVSGLMIHFRGQDGSINYIIMCQIFIAFAGGTLVIGEDMAVMAASDRQSLPMMLSLVSLCSSIGSSIGSAVSTAIYSHTFPQGLLRALPEEEKVNATAIYLGGYATQLLYPVGSPTRDAINYAWGYSQKYGAIAATCVTILLIPAIGMWKNYRVDKAQNKGTLF